MQLMFSLCSMSKQPSGKYGPIYSTFSTKLHTNNCKQQLQGHKMSTYNIGKLSESHVCQHVLKLLQVTHETVES
ncbi:hypothetical protein EXN66_Car014562 [Channa argus]|uniref:Uncharacterized protein n=1 Tax=Channa argus TaxID=215402 RepID=A0A6G1Q8J9_CHAAH|nr:hypothetical protein EXN66_Car014562 [Channa argus]